MHAIGRDAVAKLGSRCVEDRSAWGQPNGTWRVAYLNTDGYFERSLPMVYAKLRHAAVTVARSAPGWGGLLDGRSPINTRCVEVRRPEPNPPRACCLPSVRGMTAAAR